MTSVDARVGEALKSTRATALQVVERARAVYVGIDPGTTITAKADRCMDQRERERLPNSSP